MHRCKYVRRWVYGCMYAGPSLPEAWLEFCECVGSSHVFSSSRSCLNACSQSGALNMAGLCGLYRKLRDLEVNPLKRFVVLASRHRSIFSTGFDLKGNARKLLSAST